MRISRWRPSPMLAVDLAITGILAGAILAIRNGAVVHWTSPATTLTGLAGGWLGLRLVGSIMTGVRSLPDPHRDRGSITVSFVLCLPIFLMIVSIMVQLALICNAQVVVNHTAYVTGRSAITHLADGHRDAQNRIRHAAALSLAEISPAGANHATGQAMQNVLQRMAPDIDRRFAARFGYAQSGDALKIDYTPKRQFVIAHPTDLTVEVEYQFLMTVPYAASLLSPAETIGGVNGRFITLTGRSTQRTPPGRKLTPGLGAIF